MKKQLPGYKKGGWGGIEKDWIAVFVEDIEGFSVAGIVSDKPRIEIKECITYWRKPFKTQPIEIKEEIKDKAVIYLKPITPHIFFDMAKPFLIMLNQYIQGEINGRYNVK